MKKSLLLFLTCISIILVTPDGLSQGVAISSEETNPDNSAILDIISDKSGLLIPRMTEVQRNGIIEPAESLIVFNTDSKCFETYVYDIWQNIWCADNEESNKRIFVSSTEYTGNIGGLIMADSECQSRADAQGLGGTWVALMSNNSIDARDRISYNWDKLVNMQGELIATGDVNDPNVGYLNLWNGSIENSIIYNEMGIDIDGAHVFSGTAPDGQKTAYNCNNWTHGIGGTYSGTAGIPQNTGPNWIGDTMLLGVCDYQRRIYCVEQ